jgi:hypothetical protein
MLSVVPAEREASINVLRQIQFGGMLGRKIKGSVLEHSKGDEGEKMRSEVRVGRSQIILAALEYPVKEFGFYPDFSGKTLGCILCDGE